jgi:hypothetical protein
VKNGYQVQVAGCQFFSVMLVVARISELSADKII